MKDRPLDDDLNITRENIRRKRRALARQRRRRLLRALVLMCIGGVFMVAVLACAFLFIRWSAQVYDDYRAAYAGYTQRQQEKIGTPDPLYAGYTNVLLLGIDNGADVSGNPVKRADTVAVLSLNNETGAVHFLTVPRGTWVTMPDGATHDRISSAYAYGGAPAMVRTVSALTGVAIHQYVAADMQPFASLIDVLGGIDVYVECPMDYDDAEASTHIHLQQGYQHLSGQEAMGYLRYRGTDLGDLGRAQRQQKFLRLLYDRLLQVDVVPKLPDIAQIMREQVDTSAELFDSAHLANVLRHVSSAQPETVMLPGKLAADDDTIWMPDTAGMRQELQAFFPDLSDDAGAAPAQEE